MEVVPVEKTAFSDRFVRIRYTILGLTIGLILSYIAIISMDLFGRDFAFLIYSVPFLAFYNIVECICFAGCKQFEYYTFMAFRGIWLVHDFAFFITYCVFAGVWGGLYIGIVIFLALAIGLNVAIMKIFRKLPRKASCSCCSAKVHNQQTIQ